MTRPVNGDSAFGKKLLAAGQYPLSATAVEIFQINVGRACNLACRHCHLEAGPTRTEAMSRETFAACLRILRASPTMTTIDVTGGAPEMSPHLEWFLGEAAALGKRLIVRSNLVILLEEPYARFPDLYARLGVEIVGSLPDYSPERADRQRGAGNFERALSAIRLLNARGYGRPGGRLFLDLMHNPAGAFLPGPQKSLEQEYRSRLRDPYGVEFNRLFSLTNMPLGRYLEYLERTENYQEYMEDLVRSFNPGNLLRLMCRNTISICWDGAVYDCDFNQSLGLKVTDPLLQSLAAFDAEKLGKREIAVGDHCFGCTAGAGSGCQGCLE